MLTRQKVLLWMLAAADRPVSRLELTKWCFIVRQETRSQGGSSFYDFLPYKQGPFSFNLYREIEGLMSLGYVSSVDETQWQSTRLTASMTNSLPGSLRSEVSAIVSKFKKMSVNAVVDYVYDRYPRFTVISERRQLAKRTIAPLAVYTAGYEGMSIDSFLDRLIATGMQRLIDVRNNPVARRYGFHKSTLTRLCEKVQIEYLHLPELGIRSELRRNLWSQADYDDLFDTYQKCTIGDQLSAVQRVARLAREKASVLVCMEADPRCCHRTRLAESVAGIARLPIIDLGSLCDGRKC
jgi:uncharacterized protein (DUF488 family)